MPPLSLDDGQTTDSTSKPSAPTRARFLSGETRTALLGDTRVRWLHADTGVRMLRTETRVREAP